MFQGKKYKSTVSEGKTVEAHGDSEDIYIHIDYPNGVKCNALDIALKPSDAIELAKDLISIVEGEGPILPGKFIPYQEFKPLKEREYKFNSFFGNKTRISFESAFSGEECLCINFEEKTTGVMYDINGVRELKKAVDAFLEEFGELDGPECG